MDEQSTSIAGDSGWALATPNKKQSHAVRRIAPMCLHRPWDPGLNLTHHGAKCHGQDWEIKSLDACCAVGLPGLHILRVFGSLAKNVFWHPELNLFLHNRHTPSEKTGHDPRGYDSLARLRLRQGTGRLLHLALCKNSLAKLLLSTWCPSVVEFFKAGKTVLRRSVRSRPPNM
ncbi:hypothetical protein LIA77_03375 [Sarocladium implicatum]|nr:hypothetical protein LIA77_03375 [Sarocladium implicatum]